MSEHISQFIKLMSADERELALYKLIRALPPSAVKGAFELFKTELYCEEKDIGRTRDV